MKKFLALVAMVAASFAAYCDTTNVVTNVVYEARVRYDNYYTVDTNGWYETYGGTLITNKVILGVQQLWRSGKLVKVTNAVDVVVGGSTTNTIYNTTTNWFRRPYYWFEPKTNIVTTVTE